jgi:hypothetical protein
MPYSSAPYVQVHTRRDVKCCAPWSERHWCLALQPPVSAQELAAFEYISMNYPHLVAQMFPHLVQPQYHYHYGYPAPPHPQVAASSQYQGYQGSHIARNVNITANECVAAQALLPLPHPAGGGGTVLSSTLRFPTGNQTLPSLSRPARMPCF